MWEVTRAAAKVRSVLMERGRRLSGCRVNEIWKVNSQLDIHIPPSESLREFAQSLCFWQSVLGWRPTLITIADNPQIIVSWEFSVTDFISQPISLRGQLKLSLQTVLTALGKRSGKPLLTDLFISILFQTGRTVRHFTSLLPLRNCEIRPMWVFQACISKCETRVFILLYFHEIKISFLLKMETSMTFSTWTYLLNLNPFFIFLKCL